MLYGELPDEELVATLKQGDRKAFNEIYQRYSEPLFRFALNILKDEEECMDALQDVFIWFWANRSKLHVQHLKSYLFAAVKYKLARTIQNSRRKAAILSSNPPLVYSFTDQSLEIKEIKEAISEFVNTLPPKARQVFHLSRNEYLSNKEIAGRLGISEKTVENQMTISLKKLRLVLGKNAFFSILL